MWESIEDSIKINLGLSDTSMKIIVTHTGAEQLRSLTKGQINNIIKRVAKKYNTTVDDLQQGSHLSVETAQGGSEISVRMTYKEGISDEILQSIYKRLNNYINATDKNSTEILL